MPSPARTGERRRATAPRRRTVTRQLFVEPYFFQPEPTAGGHGARRARINQRYMKERRLIRLEAQDRGEGALIVDVGIGLQTRAFKQVSAIWSGDCPVDAGAGR